MRAGMCKQTLSVCFNVVHSQLLVAVAAAMSVTRGPDGQWKFDPPFAGGSYQAFKAWHFRAQEAVEEYLRLHDPMLVELYLSVFRTGWQ